MRAHFLIGLVCALAFAVDLQEIADRVNSMKTTWTAGINSRFEGKSEEYINGHFGALKSPKQLKVKKVEKANDIPAEFCPIKKWPMCKDVLETVRDQSECGSCWAFGAASAASDRLCIHSKGEKKQPVSAEDILACCGASCGMGCNGGYLTGAWDFLEEKGAVSGNDFEDNKWCSPYFSSKCEHHCEGKYRKCGPTKPTPRCNTTCANGKDYKTDKIFFLEGYQTEDDEEEIQTELMTNGPMEVSFTVYEDFMTYKKGVYQHVTGGFKGRHAVEMMGWGLENNVKYWLIKNSWNEDWGDNGYFKILRGKNECQIEAECTTAMPKL